LHEDPAHCKNDSKKTPNDRENFGKGLFNTTETQGLFI
jgi:hypothetical protein